MKSCALICAAMPNMLHFQKAYKQCAYENVIAVDGGYAFLQKCGVEPDVALGDFDSLGFVPKNIQSIVFPEDKDASDLGLALDWAIEHGFDKIEVYGAFAGRFDHTIAAIQEMTRAKEKNASVSICGISDVNKFCIISSGETAEFDANEFLSDALTGVKDKRSVSVLSLCDESAGVTITGLKYELPDATLSNRGSLGLSNEFIGQDFSISVKNGTLLIVLPLA